MTAAPALWQRAADWFAKRREMSHHRVDRSNDPMNSAHAHRRIQFVTDFYLAEMHAGIVDYARQANWILHDGICYMPSALGSYDEPSDGILALVAFPELKDWLLQRKVPVIRMHCAGRELPFPAVEPDPVAIGATAARHLLTLGQPHFAYYSYGNSKETDACWEGFAAVLRAAGTDPIRLNFSTATGQAPDARPLRDIRWAWLRDRLSQLPRPLAVLAEDDRFLIDLFQAAAMLGWRVPEDIALMGQDDRALILGKLPVPATSLDTGLWRIGHEAAALLDRMLGGEEVPSEVWRVPPGAVVARRSTEVCYHEHAGVSAAITWLRQNFRQPLTIHSLACKAGIGTRTLQQHFKSATGHTFKEELTRLRLDHAAGLLRETDLKLESVAQEAGFANAKYLCDTFRKAFATSPAAYRKSHYRG